MKYLVYLLCGCIAIVSGEDTDTCCSLSKPPQTKYLIQYGDPQNCPQSEAFILETLPGSGWDNLRNMEMAPVLQQNYSSCKISRDKKYVIPDNVDVEALKESNVRIYSTLISHFSDYTSTTSFTINAEAHAQLKLFQISGSFSRSHQEAKELISGDRTTVSRSEMRYRVYNIRSIPDSRLHATFRNRILDIVSRQQNNDTETARYLAQLVVRDFGTHVVNLATAGAVIVQEDYLNQAYMRKMDSDRTTISAAASASFLGMFGGGVSFTDTVTHQQVTEYRQSREYTETDTKGGPLFRVNSTINDFVDKVDNNLVIVDRNGDPIYNVITPEALPEVPLDSIRQVVNLLKEAVMDYYKHNVYQGCTSIDSPNFSYIANLDDGTCTTLYTNHSFGGIYQSCTGGICDGKFMQKNPKTQDYSCPPQYTAVLMYEHTEFYCVRRCDHFIWIEFNCYDDCRHTDTSPNAAHYTAYWCAATGIVSNSSGYLFGGVYTDMVNNPLTNDKSCPEYFTALKLGFSLRMYVCVSDDDELGFRYSLPFGGFYNCKNGNPLALAKNITQVKAMAAQNPVTSLSAFTFKEGPQAWPKRCPAGYSQHLVSNSDTCELNYCLKANSLFRLSLPVIRRPPYDPEPKLIYKSSDGLFVASNNLIWIKSGFNSGWEQTDYKASPNSEDEMLELLNPNKQDDSKPNHASQSSSAGTIAGSVIGTLAAVAIAGVAGVAGVAIWYRRNKFSKRREYRRSSMSVEGSGEEQSLLGSSHQGSYPPISTDHEVTVS